MSTAHTSISGRAGSMLESFLGSSGSASPPAVTTATQRNGSTAHWVRVRAADVVKFCNEVYAPKNPAFSLDDDAERRSFVDALFNYYSIFPVPSAAVGDAPYDSKEAAHAAVAAILATCTRGPSGIRCSQPVTEPPSLPPQLPTQRRARSAAVDDDTAPTPSPNIDIELLAAAAAAADDDGDVAMESSSSSSSSKAVVVPMHSPVQVEADRVIMALLEHLQTAVDTGSLLETSAPEVDEYCTMVSIMYDKAAHSKIRDQAYAVFPRDIVCGNRRQRIATERWRPYLHGIFLFTFNGRRCGATFFFMFVQNPCEGQRIDFIKAYCSQASR